MNNNDYIQKHSDIRSFCLYLKNVKHLNPRTINVYIAHMRDFFIYVLHKDWDIREVPYLHYDEPLPSFLTVTEVNRLIDSFTNIKHKSSVKRSLFSLSSSS